MQNLFELMLMCFRRRNTCNVCMYAVVWSAFGVAVVYHTEADVIQKWL